MENLKQKVHEIIFEADTKEGKLFDVVLLVLIALSVFTVILESVKDIQADYGELFITLEWIFTVLFTFEFIIRLWCVKKPLAYAYSFFGIVDILSLLPTYIGLLHPAGSAGYVVIRMLRLLRVFRIFKLARFIGEGNELMRALKASRAKIIVFMGVVTVLVTILGTIMYIIEGGIEDTGFTSIPRSIYWAIVTLTTVGYGDIAPQTITGQFIASVIMILGYGIIAVPTGIVTSELALLDTPNTQSCRYCGQHNHKSKAIYCHQCSHKLD